MPARLIGVVLETMVLPGSATACGGDDSSSPSAEPQAVVTEIERIRDDAAAEAQEAQGEFPVAGFDPENPNPTDLPGVGNYFSTGHPIWDEAFEAADELGGQLRVLAARTLVRTETCRG